MALIACRNTALGYGGHAVVEGLGFQVNPGDYLCVIGENGAGKSTLMRTLLHLQPPLSGEITLGDGLRANEIGYLPQQTPVQRDFPASVREIVQSGCLNGCGLRPFYNRTEKRRAAESMERLGIAPLAGRCYRELSGGQQQRVLLARALCAAKRLLLLDEPAAGLDPQASGEMYALVRGLNREGMAVVMVSHDLEGALTDASHVLHLAHHPLFFGPRADYLESEAGQAFLRRRKEARAHA